MFQEDFVPAHKFKVTVLLAPKNGPLILPNLFIFVAFFKAYLYSKKKEKKEEDVISIAAASIESIVSFSLSSIIMQKLLHSETWKLVVNEKIYDKLTEAYFLNQRIILSAT